MSDIWDALTNPQIQATPAMIASLRNQNLMGQLGMITGDKVMGALGQNVSQSAQGQAEQLGKNYLTEQQRQTEQNWRDTQEAHYQAEEEQARNALSQTMKAEGDKTRLGWAQLGYTNGPPTNQPGASGTQVYDSLSPADKLRVDQIGTFHSAPLNSFAKNPRHDLMMAAVAEKYPDWSPEMYKSVTDAVTSYDPKNKNGQALKSADVAVQHLDSIGGEFDKMGNTKIPLWNQISNKVMTELGYAQPTKVEAMRDIVTNEVNKYIQGGGIVPVHDKARLESQLNTAQSPAQFRAVINGWLQLMGGQVQGMKQQWDTDTKGIGGELEQKLSPRTREVLGMPTTAETVAQEEGARRNAANYNAPTMPQPAPTGPPSFRAPAAAAPMAAPGSPLAQALKLGGGFNAGLRRNDPGTPSDDLYSGSDADNNAPAVEPGWKIRVKK